VGSLIESKTNDKSPGYAVMIIKDSEIIYLKNIGLADLASHKEINQSTAFYLASLSKQFTAMAIMILYERGELVYDDPISKYFPEFPDYGKEITIRNLLTHSSGLRDHYDVVGVDIDSLTNQDVWNVLKTQDSLQFKPGSKMQYSNSGYVLLAMLVERITAQPFSRFLTENIFAPLEMKNTLVYDERKPYIANRGIGYIRNDTGSFSSSDYTLSTTGAGGMYSTLEDLYKWDQALNSEKLVKNETFEDALSSFLTIDRNKTNYGFGWMSNEYEGIDYHYHTGSLKGFRNIILRIPEHQFTFIVLSNAGEHLLTKEHFSDLFFQIP
jgi:CubicO group peptidase (beta-lactamase class C family)